MPTTGKLSLSNLVGIGSRRQVDGLDDEIVEINCGRTMSEK